MRAPIFMLSLLTLVAWGAGVSFSQQAADFAPAVAPFVDKQTVAIVHIDLAAFDAAKTAALFADLFKLSPEVRDRIQANIAPLNVVADSLPDDARADMYFVFSISDLATLPMFFVLPRETEAANPISLEVRRTVSAQTSTKMATEEIAGSLVTGSPQTIARLKKATPAQRPEIAAAFESVASSAVHVLLVPAPDALRAIEVLVPKLPEPLGGGPTKQLTGGFAWLAVGLDLPPQPPRFRLVVQTTGTEAAAALAAQIDKILATLAGHAEVRAAVPNSADLARRLVPKIAGDRLTLELTEAEIGAVQPLLLSVLKATATALAPPPAGKKTSAP